MPVVFRCTNGAERLPFWSSGQSLSTIIYYNNDLQFILKLYISAA